MYTSTCQSCCEVCTLSRNFYRIWSCLNIKMINIYTDHLFFYRYLFLFKRLFAHRLRTTRKGIPSKVGPGAERSTNRSQTWKPFTSSIQPNCKRHNNFSQFRAVGGMRPLARRISDPHSENRDRQKSQYAKLEINSYDF